MNRKSTNEFRSALGLQPFVVSRTELTQEQLRKRRQAQNRAERAEESRRLKSIRSRGGK